MIVLGLSGSVADASAVVLDGGVARAAARESWFSRVPGDPAFPKRALRWCLLDAGISPSDIDLVAWAEKPLARFEATLFDGLRRFPRGSGRFACSMQEWLGDRLWIRTRITTELGIDPGRIRFVRTPLAHAAAAFHLGSHARAAILVDGCCGESTDHSHALGAEHAVRLVRWIHGTHSIAELLRIATSALRRAAAHECGDPFALAGAATTRSIDAMRACVIESADGSFRYEADHVAATAQRMPAADAAAAIVALATEWFEASIRTLTADAGAHAVLVAGDLARVMPNLAARVTHGALPVLDASRVTGGAAAAFGAASVVAGDELGAPRRCAAAVPCGPAALVTDDGVPAPNALARALEALRGGETIACASGRFDFLDGMPVGRVVVADSMQDDAEMRLRHAVPGAFGAGWRPTILSDARVEPDEVHARSSLALVTEHQPALLALVRAHARATGRERALLAVPMQPAGEPPAVDGHHAMRFLRSHRVAGLLTDDRFVPNVSGAARRS
ncbi:MAG: hypothetical protein IPH13_02265 [Planctomycetes bacterium]|nr:hypothetical protein [Planctomycetota bacterium]